MCENSAKQEIQREPYPKPKRRTGRFKALIKDENEIHANLEMGKDIFSGNCGIKPEIAELALDILIGQAYRIAENKNNVRFAIQRLAVFYRLVSEYISPKDIGIECWKEWGARVRYHYDQSHTSYLQYLTNDMKLGHLICFLDHMADKASRSRKIKKLMVAKSQGQINQH